MALTNDHFKRISAFVNARLDDVFTSIYSGQETGPTRSACSARCAVPSPR